MKKDMIYRADAIEAVGKLLVDGQTARVDGKFVPLHFALMNTLSALPSAEALQNLTKPNKELIGSDLISRAEVHKTLSLLATEGGTDAKMLLTDAHEFIDALPSAEAEDRLYIKIYADDEPSVKAEKLYQICDETQNREVGEWLKEYFPSAEAVQGWIPCSERLPKAEDMYQPPEQRYLCQLEAHGVKKFCVLSRLKGAFSPFWDWYGIAVYDSEVIAWMPLPKPYREESEVGE